MQKHRKSIITEFNNYRYILHHIAIFVVSLIQSDRGTRDPSHGSMAEKVLEVKTGMSIMVAS